MRGRLVLAAIATAAAVGATAGHSESLRETPESTTFVDAVAEDPAAPDIGTVVVSNDDSGLLTVRIEIPSHPVLTEDLRIRVWLDTDANSETGLRGADRYLYVDRWELGLGEARSSSATEARAAAARPCRRDPGRLFVSPTGTGRRSRSRRLTWASWDRSASRSGSRPGAVSDSIRSPGATTSRTRDRTSLPTVPRGGWAIRAPRGRMRGSTTPARCSRAASPCSRRSRGRASSSACGWRRSAPTPEAP